MAETAKLSSTFQVAIPESVRAAQNWKAGDTIAFIPKGNGVLMVPAPDRETLLGIAAGADTSGYRDRTDRV